MYSYYFVATIPSFFQSPGIVFTGLDLITSGVVTLMDLFLQARSVMVTLIRFKREGKAFQVATPHVSYTLINNKLMSLFSGMGMCSR